MSIEIMQINKTMTDERLTAIDLSIRTSECIRSDISEMDHEDRGGKNEEEILEGIMVKTLWV